MRTLYRARIKCCCRAVDKSGIPSDPWTSGTCELRTFQRQQTYYGNVYIDVDEFTAVYDISIEFHSR